MHAVFLMKTLLFRHRYTGNFICATRCDGSDDLCEHRADEKGCSISLTLLIVVYILCGTTLVMPLMIVLGHMYKFSVNRQVSTLKLLSAKDLSMQLLKKFNKLKKCLTREKSFSRRQKLALARLLHKNSSSLIRDAVLLMSSHDLGQSVKFCSFFYDLEITYHKSEEKALACLKKDVGTNTLAAEFMRLVDRGFMVKLKLLLLRFRIIHSFMKTGLFHKAEKLFALFSIKVRFLVYYNDLIKDILVINLMLKFESIEHTRLDAMGTQIILLLLGSILVSSLANIITIMTNQTLKLSVIKKGGLCLLFPFVPAIAIFFSERLHSQRIELAHKVALMETTKNANSFLEDLDLAKSLEDRRIVWQKFLSELRRNENIFENFIQHLVLAAISFYTVSNTITVPSRQTKALVSTNGALIVASAALSMRTLTMGQLRFATMEKDGFLPTKGKIIMGLYLFLSTFFRVNAVVWFFTPALGMQNTMYHFKMGSVPLDEGLKTVAYDIQWASNKSLVITSVGYAWKPVRYYAEMTQLSLRQIYQLFLVLYFAHTIIMFGILLATSKSFASMKGSPVKKFFHVLSQYLCPTMYKDWEAIEGVDSVDNAIGVVWHELGVKLLVFTLFNAIYLVPMYLLRAKIRARNVLLSDSHFQLLDEEKQSTETVEFLCTIGPIIFLLVIPAMQILLLWLYYYHGHPWAKMWSLRRLQQKRSSEVKDEDLDEKDLFLHRLFH